MVIKYRPKHTRYIEAQIEKIYEEALVVPKRPGPGVKPQYYFHVTPEQEEQIIELVEQLPPEKQEEYFVVQEEPVTPIEPPPSPIISKRPVTYGRTAVPHVPKPPTPEVLKVGRAVLPVPIPREQIVSPHEIFKEPVTTTLFKATEALLHPEQVIAGFLPEDKRQAYLGTVEPLTHVRETPALKSFEEFAYVPAGFVGTFERYWVPSIPTPSTAIMQPIFEGGRLTEAQFLAEHPGYALGGFLGEWFQAKYIWGPPTEKVLSKVKAWGQKAYQLGHEKLGMKLPEWAQKRLWGYKMEHWLKTSPVEPILPETTDAFEVLVKGPSGWTRQTMVTTYDKTSDMFKVLVNRRL